MKTLFMLTVFLVAPALRADNLDGAIQAYRQRQIDATPQSVLAWLRAGNERFARGNSSHGDFPTDMRKQVLVTATGQRPLAVVLSCIDSRTTPELAFDVAVGDLFTARVGANVINDDILGSMEIAVESGAKVVLIMGHTDCGGVKGACSGLVLDHMTQLLERVKPAIAAAHAHLDANPALAAEIGERVVTNRRYIAHVSHFNAVQSARQVLERSPLLKAKVDNGEIILKSALYDVDSGRVVFD